MAHLLSGHLLSFTVLTVLYRFSRFPFQLYNIRIYIQQLTQNTFPHIVAPWLLSQLYAVPLTLNKAAVTALLWLGSKVTGKPDTCHFIDTISLVISLIRGCLCNTLSTCHVLWLLFFANHNSTTVYISNAHTAFHSFPIIFSVSTSLFVLHSEGYRSKTENAENRGSNFVPSLL